MPVDFFNHAFIFEQITKFIPQVLEFLKSKLPGDAAAALLGLCLVSDYEGEAPMRLEALCEYGVSPVRRKASYWSSGSSANALKRPSR